MRTHVFACRHAYMPALCVGEDGANVKPLLVQCKKTFL